MSFQSILRVIRTPVAIDSGITFAGTIAGAGIDLIALALVSRVLEPAGFGVYATYLTVMTLVGGVTDFGLGLILTHFFAQNRDRDAARAQLYSQMVFWLKLAIAVAMVVLGTLFASVLAPWLLGDSNQSEMFVVALWGGFGIAMGSFIIAYLRGSEQFLRRSLYSLSGSGVKFVIILALFSAGVLTAASAVTGSAFALLLLFGVGLLLIPRSAMRFNRTALSLLWSEFFKFGKWVMVWFVLGAIIPRIDLLLLNGMASDEVVGWYAAATRLCLLLLLLDNALTIVIVPKISRIDSRAQMDRFLKGWRLFAFVVLLGGLIPLELLAQPLVELVYGASYLPAVPIFRLLLIAFFLELVFTPVSYLSFAFNQPKLMTFSHLIRLVILVAGIYVLVPQFGAIGASLAVVLSIIISYAFLVGTVFFQALPAYYRRHLV